MAMLAGRRISLRPVRDADLDLLYDAYVDLKSRGLYYPLGIMSESTFSQGVGGRSLRFVGIGRPWRSDV